MTDDRVTEGPVADDALQLDHPAPPAAPAADERPPIELTEAALEALLFVAERPLSRREIAQLASQGQSSREIADALVVSPRTVENHLQRAYEKLGVRGRADLADALTRASL